MGTKKGWSSSKLLLWISNMCLRVIVIKKMAPEVGKKNKLHVETMTGKKGARGWKRVEKYHVINLYFLDC